MSNPTPETPNEYLALPDDQKSLAKAFIGKKKKFQGKELYPYTEGVRIVMDDIDVGTRGVQRFFMTLMFVLIDLQEAYEAAKQANDKLTDEQAGVAAFAALSEQIGDDPHVYKGKVSVRAGQMSKAACEEARQIGQQIWKEWKDSELVPAEDKKEGDQAGK